MKNKQASSIRHINYRTDVNLYANRCLINSGLLLDVAELISGDQMLDASNLLKLAVLVEAVVLNEKIIVEDDIVASDLFEIKETHGNTVADFVEVLNKANTFENDPSYTLDNLNMELSGLVQPANESTRVFLVHGSHIIIEKIDKNPFSEEDKKVIAENGFILTDAENWKEVTNYYFDDSYINELKTEGYYGLDFSPTEQSDSLLVPWQIVANCHGIPYIQDELYSLKLANNAPTNIGIDLYTKLEHLHGKYFQEIRKYLGPTYISIPPLLGIVLQKCSTVENIPESIADTRVQFEDFRKKCTLLETELRKAELIKDQLEVIKEVEVVYEALASKVSSPKKRVMARLFDVIKEIDPVEMGSEVLGQAKDYVVERESLLKIPGYYDLWKASLEVKQGLPLLRQLFRGQVSSNFLDDFDKIMKLTRRKGLTI